MRIATIRITGDDALDFLQGQLTNDLRRLENEAEILAAWCNPKGRVIWFGSVAKIDDGYELSALMDRAADIVRRLTMFRFRAKVDFEVVDEGRTVEPSSLIDNGLPWIGNEQSEQFTPHMLNLDLLDAVSFDKGCYTGQEIVARTHYKGATKRRAARFECDGAVVAGDKVMRGERAVGEVLNVAGNALLAVVPTDVLDEELTVGAAALRHRPLPYWVDVSR
jgi:folate-binding protein YgfZ